MSSSAYLANWDDTSPVNFDLDPTPTPLVNYTFSSTRRKTLNKRGTTGEITPGPWHHYTGGTHESGGVINVGIVRMTRSQYDQVIDKVKSSRCGIIVFSPDGGESRYRCVIDPGNRGLRP